MHLGNLAALHITGGTEGCAGSRLNEDEFVIQGGSVFFEDAFHIVDEIVVEASFLIPNVSDNNNRKPVFFQTAEGGFESVRQNRKELLVCSLIGRIVFEVIVRRTAKQQIHTVRLNVLPDVLPVIADVAGGHTLHPFIVELSLFRPEFDAGKFIAEIGRYISEYAIASETVERLAFFQPEPTANEFSHNRVEQ